MHQGMRFEQTNTCQFKKSENCTCVVSSTLCCKICTQNCQKHYHTVLADVISPIVPRETSVYLRPIVTPAILSIENSCYRKENTHLLPCQLSTCKLLAGHLAHPADDRATQASRGHYTAWMCPPKWSCHWLVCLATGTLLFDTYAIIHKFYCKSADQHIIPILKKLERCVKLT